MTTLARWKPIGAAVAVGLVAALAYLAIADERYAAEAKLQVVPLPAADAIFAGFALPRVSSGASAAKTVADLVERPAVVDAAAVRLGLEREQVLEAVSVSADDASNVVSVRAEATDPVRAAQLANAVAAAFVGERSAVFQGDLNRTIGELRDRVRTAPASERDPRDVSRLAALEASLGQRDPTIRIAGDAVARDDPVSVGPTSVLATALGISLLLGIAAAAAFSVRAPATRLESPAVARREAELARRLKAVTERERALARRAGELAAREQHLGEHQAAARSAKELVPETEPHAMPPPSGAWNVRDLERLVDRHGPEFPDRVEEWRSYLFFLREHASMEGELPSSFDALVEEAFEPLL